MRNLTPIAMVVSLTALSLVTAPRVKADEWNKLTKFTFNEPVEIPGQVLPAGTYWFKLMDSQSDRNIVQIFNKDQNHVFATILAIPDYRLKPTGKTVLTFAERPAGTPPAVRAWFYPGDNYGQEFVYPKMRATQLAKAEHRPVPSMPENLEANTKMAAKSVKEPQLLAQSTAPANPPATLPATGSSLPLIALIGSILATAGFLLGLFEKKTD